ncbi:hypothetical protein TD95_004470 [Thielaviopsis punctulata]|uniref:Serine/threonine-protein kinase ppk6 n=1 Tax=Thielaviopsis punctulata TaxID=72032 RepID=A0A0F4ZKY8_9PEZI|nr:hypothetical protein TD95_004470 [Thielaviopsis punctulata]
MSAQLLADLDSFYSQPSQPAPATSQASAFGPSSQSSAFGFSSFQSTPAPASNNISSAADDDEDDGWGDFETATSSAPSNVFTAPTVASQSQTPSTFFQSPIVSTSSNSFIASNSAFKMPSPSTRVMRSNTLDIMTNNLVDLNLMDSATPTPPVVKAQPESKPPSYAQFKSQSTAPVWARPASVVSSSEPPPYQQSIPQKKPANDNMLFDADDFDDAEFGEFESVPEPAEAAKPKPKPTPLPSCDLLSLDLDFITSAPVSAQTSSHMLAPISTNLASNAGSLSATTPQQQSSNFGTLSLLKTPSPTGVYPQAPKSPSFQERNPYPSLSLKTPTQATFHINKPEEKAEQSASPITAWPSNDTGSTAVKDWPAFEDFPDDPPKVSNPVEKKSNVDALGISWDWDSMESTANKSIDKNQDKSSPPTNIPPPSVLMSILPDLFELANKVLFKPLSSQSAAVKKEVMQDERTVAFLRGYLLIAATAARIVAGRKLRWHRDKFLSQSMSISAAGSKGMKLAGVDKSQTIREDREAADVVASWKTHVGRLRSGLAAANASSSMKDQEPLKAPEISESMMIKTAKMVPTAPKACVLCGLKREERVAKVDFEVEDSFGEWWIEYWGHRTCKNFWKEHEKTLRSR